MRSTPGLTPLIGIVNVGVMIVAAVVLLVHPLGGDDEPTTGQVTAPSPQPSPTATPTREPQRASAESARRVRANELGMVPVLMYHRILRKPVASIDRTPSQLRRELERLAKGGYVPITAAQYASGAIDVPAGAHPVVLSFDDGHPSHFALGPDGAPVPDTVVAVLYDVAARFPGFRPVATFWINKTPFGLRDRERQAQAVRWLVEHGFEVANHTYSHPDLRRLRTKKVNEAIVRGERLVTSLGAPPSYTFALPYGSRPKKRSAARKGKWDGTSYAYRAVFMAGSEPSVSPYAKTFDPYNIPRIQANGKKGECRRWCSEYWLGWLDKHPDRRYTSDGDPTRVSMPRRFKGKIQAKFREAMIAY
ncbi:xylanase [Sphaerisporangium siamense]|uniref:Peptidoglycan/xylan/chitin deacetylase (PgdA/CDA1 family) n=1 Tax=Sphaerisporangium siamense TaxID=795645 RepID=A0A7W7DDA3_9ACTN|nr:polysaccharide deacetylase family protein [Sphaerisporangium siamense]MBB4704683.1 peptidoglycan/xylan/chitin deacetylase (PgdA/CDA1 family) [Sphaerisporangium siamense]GII86298.1 xylanase [Sphaerisporangium siamense]